MKGMKTEILCMTRPELADWLAALEQPAYRAAQIQSWLLKGVPFSDMNNLPRALRALLEEHADPSLPAIERKYVSAVDGTVKYVLRLRDGQLIESVVMRYKHGNTICVSSQAGCRMGCRFCASNTGGLARSLTPSEMLGEVIVAQRDTGERISNIVLMGIGEPLDNYDNVMTFLRRVSAPDTLNIGSRHISLSTCGLADKIERLAEEELQITLSISLHAVSDEERSDLMPVNRKWNLDALLRACRAYFDRTGRRISFEYTLIAGVNDDDAHARRLAALLHRYFGKDAPFHVNLIPVNEVKGRGFASSAFARRFADTLGRCHVNATVRRRLGPDINASCGQLVHRSTLTEALPEPEPETKT